MTNFKIFLFIFLNFIVTYAKISDLRKCANEDCSELVSLAKTLLKYPSDDSRILSFPANVNVKIFSKEAGTRLDLWGAEINGKRGYVPIKLVREMKIFTYDLPHLVPTEGQDDPKVNPAPTILIERPSSKSALDSTSSSVKASVQDQISPNAVTPPYEIIDGTTIYLPPSDNSSPEYSSTPSSVDSSKVHPPDNSSPETKIETEIINPDRKLVIDNLNSQEIPETKEEIKTVEEKTISKEENAISKEENSEGMKIDDNLGSSVFDQITKYLFEDEDDSDLEVEEESAEVEDKNEDYVEEETSTEAAQESKKLPVPAEVIEEKNVNATEIPEPVNTPVVDSSNSVVNETNEINPASVISSPEPVQDKVNHVYVSKPFDPEPPQVEIVTEKQTEPSQQVVGEPKSEQLNETKTEEIRRIVEEKNGVPSDLPNPLNLFHQPLKENEAKIDASQIQVPENLLPSTSNENQPSTLPVAEEIIPTTQATVDEFIPPIDDLKETFTENPVLINQNQSDSATEIIETSSEQREEKTVEQIKTKDETVEKIETKEETVGKNEIKEVIVEQPEIKDAAVEQTKTKEGTVEKTETKEVIVEQTEIKDAAVEQTETTTEKVSEDKENVYEILSQTKSEVSEEKVEDKEINYDKAEEPTFIDAVGAKYNSLVAEEIPQNNNNLDQSIENVSDSFEDPVTEKLVNELTSEQNAIVEEVTDSVSEENDEPSFFSKMYNSVFGSGDEQVVPIEEKVSESENIKISEIIDEPIEKPAEKISGVYESMWGAHFQEKPVEKYLPSQPEVPIQSDMQSCASSDNPALCGEQIQNDYVKNENIVSGDEISWSFELPENAYNMFLYLSLTAVTVLLFSLGFYYIEKKRKDGALIASINTLEKKLLISTKECLLVQDELKTTKERLVSIEDSSFGSNEMVTSLKEELEDSKLSKIELEEHISNLEKELENATEAGMELNKMLREILTSQSGNVHMMQNVEHLQKQLNEQQETINSMKATLGAKNTENELLQTELSVANEKNAQLQEELNKMVVNLLSVQEEKNNIENKLEDQNEKLKSEYETTMKQINHEINILKDDNSKLKQRIEDTQRVLDLKNNEYDLLKQGMNEIQAVQSNKDSIMALLDVSHVKAEVQQLRDEKHKMAEKLQKEIDNKSVFEKEVQVMIQEVKILKDKFEEAEKEKVEAQTRLEVLSAYFKDKETQLQKEINENESKFMQKEGEATSTIERIKWIQEELQNYKAQNELLKKEILDQEVSLKSQISMLEKKSHDNWVLARQAERRLDESKQDASQLRNRLTIVEKNLNNSTHMADESKLSNRIMSPLESNGEIPVSPLHMGQVDAPGSPPLLFPHRDHIMTTSPPIPGIPPFMPPPPGVGMPFMPPPIPGVPPFMPPPPALFPGDHRPPPLGRMSSPPLHGRYSPDSRAYSPYDRDDSPPLSPSYPDSDYRRRSPPPPTSHMQRTYSPYSGKSARPPPHWERDEDRDYRGPQRNKPRTHKGLSSGSGNSNESLDNSGRHSGRV